MQINNLVPTERTRTKSSLYQYCSPKHLELDVKEHHLRWENYHNIYRDRLEKNTIGISQTARMKTNDSLISITFNTVVKSHE